MFFSVAVWSPNSSSSLASPSPTTSDTVSEPVSGKLTEAPPLPPHPCSVSATSGHQQSTNQRGVNYLVCTDTHSHPVYSGGPDWKGGYYPGEIITSYDPRDTIVPPPYSSTTYADFDQFGDVQIERAFNLSELYPTTTTTSAHQQSASTLPRSMTIMSGKSSAQSTRSEAHHVANVYEVKEHPVHKYWTLPRSIATGS